MLKNLLVRNLPATVDASHLENLFEEVADVEEITMDTLLINEKEHRVAYVVTKTEEGAYNAIQRFNGHATYGTSLIVTEDTPHLPDPNFAESRKALKKAKSAKAKPAKAVKA